MSAITSITDIRRRFLQGKGFLRPLMYSVNAAVTAANAASGFITGSLNVNTIGTTVPGTIVGFQMPPGTDALRLMTSELGCNTTESGWVGWYYRLGTADLTSVVGNRFTHDGTFTRLTRTRGGVATQNISMIPLLYVTAAASVTQATYTLTYNDQDGNNTVGTLTNQLPAAATAVQGLYNLMPDEGDCAIQDLTAITVSVVAVGATANIYGFEPLAFFSTVSNGWLSFVDNIYGGTNMLDTRPATPDAGSLTQQFLGIYSTSNIIGGVGPIYLTGFNNA